MIIEFNPLFLNLTFIFVVSLIILVRSKLKSSKLGILFSSTISTFVFFIYLEYLFFSFIYQIFSSILIQHFGEIGNILLIIVLPGLLLFITFTFIVTYLSGQILESETIQTSLLKALKSIPYITLLYIGFVLLCGITGGITYIISTNPQFSELTRKYPIFGLFAIIIAMTPIGALFGTVYFFATKPIKSITNSRKNNINFKYFAKSSIKKISLDYRFNGFMVNLFKRINRQVSEDFVPTTYMSSKFEYSTNLMDTILKLPKEELKSLINNSEVENLKIIFTNMDTVENLTISLSSVEKEYQEFALNLFTLKSSMTSDFEKFMKKEISLEDIGYPKKLKIEVEYVGNEPYDLVFWNKK